MGERLRKILHDKGITPYRIQKDIGISEGTIRGWFKGKIPRSDHLLKVSKYLNVDPEYLLLGDIAHKPTLRKEALLIAEEIAQYGVEGIHFAKETLKLLRTAKEATPATSEPARHKAGSG